VRLDVVARCDVVAVEAIGVGEQIAELGEGVTADARNGGAPARVFLDEILDDRAAELVFEIEDVVRDAKGRRDRTRVVDGIEGAARPIGDLIAIAEQLHGCADDVVSLFDEQGRRDGTVDPS